MAEVQDRHRKAARPYACSDYGPDGAIGSIAESLLADQEAEIAAALANMGTPALVIEKGYNDGFQLGVLAAVTLVRSGGWRVP